MDQQNVLERQAADHDRLFEMLPCPAFERIALERRNQAQDAEWLGLRDRRRRTIKRRGCSGGARRLSAMQSAMHILRPPLERSMPAHIPAPARKHEKSLPINRECERGPYLVKTK